MNDLRFAVRSLLRMRALAIIAVATLALGIGATTTMFSAVYAALVRPLPFEQPDRLVLLFTTRTTALEGLTLSRWSRALIGDLSASVTSFDPIASFTPSLVAIGGGTGEPEQIDAEIVSPDYFGTLRVRAAVGRTFMPDEDGAPGEAPVALLSDRLWRQRYGGAPAVIGTAVWINGVPLTVVGIMPVGFAGLSERSQIWIPRTMAPQLTYDGYLTTPQLFIGVVARLKDGVTLERANAELAAASASFRSAGRRLDGTGAVARTLAEARVDPTLRRSVLLLLGAAGCVLLIACANVASLLLARGRARRRELAIRIAIGSGRMRIVRQLLAEGLVLATVSGLLGAVLAAWGVVLFARYTPVVLISGRTSMSTFSAPSLDVRSLLFAIGLTLATSVLCALAPAADVSRTLLTEALREDERGGGPRRRAFRALVVGEVAAALVLLGAAGVLLASFARMHQLRRGFQSEGVLTFWVRPPVSRYPAAAGPAVLERLLAGIHRVPGVESAAVNRCTPFTGCSRSVVFFADRPVETGNAPVVGRHYVSADYFRTLGIPLLAGRVFTDDDRAGRPGVTVISDSAARRFWPGESPIGKRVWFGTTTGPFADRAHAAEVVGVVGDVKYEAVDWPASAGRPEFYTSYLQFSYSDSMVIVRTRGTTTSLVAPLRRAVAAFDSALPIYDVQTLDDRIAAALSRPRFNAAIVAAFAAAATLLAALGVYGMLSYAVSLRRREISVRLAVGAAPGRIVTLVVAEGLRLAGAGVVLGLGASAVAGPLVRGLLVDVAPSDPRILAAVALLMLAVAALAAYLPARRASLVDPVRALRQE